MSMTLLKLPAIVISLEGADPESVAYQTDAGAHDIEIACTGTMIQVLPPETGGVIPHGD
jgi:hypothetical protein